MEQIGYTWSRTLILPETEHGGYSGPRLFVAAGKAVEMKIMFQNGRRRVWQSWGAGTAGSNEANQGAVCKAGGPARQGAALLGWRIKAEPNAMDRLQVDLGIGFKIFSELGDEYIHASAQEIIIFTPDV